MKNKSIVFTAPYVTEIIEEEIPIISDTQVLVKILLSTISAGTERANLIGDANVNSTRAPRVNFPRRCGYCCAGEVVAVGENVTSVAVGDLVACSWSKYSLYCAMNENNVYKLDDKVSLENAAMMHIATFPMAAVRKCKVEIGESALVMGLGILGLMAVKILRAAGATPIIAVDPIAEKREKALRFGADFALDPFKEGFAQKVKQLTDGGADAAIEVTGKGSGLDGALDCMRPMGRVALLGCTRSSDFSIDYYRKVHGPGITLIGAHTQARPKNDSSNGWWSERDDAKALLKLMATGRMEFADMIEETSPVSDAVSVFDRLAKDPAFPIVQLDWRNME